MSIYVFSDEDIDLSLIERAYDGVLSYVGQVEPVCVEMSTCSIDEIRAVNLEVRGIDRPTDVLSFPALPLSVGDVATLDAYPNDVDIDSEEIILGEVLICLDVAKSQAIEYGHSTDREIAYLTVHSMLHLFGYDHEMDEDKAVMRRAEESILRDMNLTRE